MSYKLPMEIPDIFFGLYKVPKISYIYGVELSSSIMLYEYFDVYTSRAGQAGGGSFQEKKL